MADLAKVQRNVKRIIDGGGSREQVLTYLGGEGVQPETLRAYGRRSKEYDSGSLAASKFTMGLTDKAAGVASAIGGEIREALGKSEPATFGERYNRGVKVEQAAKQAYQDASPVVDTMTAPLGWIGGGAVGRAASTAGLSKEAARRVMGREGAIAGAVGGGVSALGDAEGGVADQAGQTLMGIATGAGLGYTLGRYVPAAIEGLADAAKPRLRQIGQMLRPRREAVQTGAEEMLDDAIDGRQVYEAAKRLGVDVLPADVGGPTLKRTTGAMAQTLGASPIARGAQRTAATAGRARDRIATEAGTVADEAGAGQAFRRGAEHLIETTKARGSQLYEAIPIRADAEAVVGGTRRALSEMTRGMQSNPELSRMFRNSRLEGYLEALTPEMRPSHFHGVGGDIPVPVGGKLSWQDMKRFRSAVGEMVGEARFSDDTTRKQLQRLYAALSDDMEATARAQGPKAYQAFRRANTYWRAREQRIDNVLTPILGDANDKGPQAIFEGIERMAGQKGGDALKLGQAMRSMPPDEAATVRATIIDRLGRANPSAQDPNGELFSPETFLTQWNKMSPRAKAVLFHDPKLRAGLDDLAKVAHGVRQSNRYANVSQTGGAVNLIALLASGPAGFKLGAAQYAGGKLLASPKFVEWLMRTPQVREPMVRRAMQRHIGQLSGLAAKEPAIRNEVLAMQQRLQEALANPVPLAASDDPRDAGRKPPQRQDQ